MYGSKKKDTIILAKRVFGLLKQRAMKLIVFIFNLDGCCDYAYDFGIDPDIRYNGIVIGNNHVRMYDFVWI